jgi:TM2 domain-containing membrane protein YozV
VTFPEPNPDPTTPEPYGQQPTSDYTAYTGPTQPYTPEPGYVPPPTYVMPGTPPPGYAGVDAYGRPLSDKTKVVAGILQIVPGFGVGRFYIGDNKTATIQLVVTICTFGLGHIWCIIDGIMILVNGGMDAQGRVLRD